jgi:acetylornithine deacetylase/succinyl-diaminopimelate desuccinylase family protein
MDDLTGTLARLISINSINPEWSGPGEAEIGAFVREFLEKAGLEVWEDEVLPGRSNIMARLPGRDSSRSVLLEAHLDTVSVTDMTIPPFDPVIKDGRLYGRGSCDTKAGLAAMMIALTSLRAEGATPPCDVYFAAVIDEENAFRGVLRLIDWLHERGIHPEAAIVAEPTELRAVSCNKGVLRWQIETRGLAAHSSKPHLGINAIVTMARVIDHLERHHAALRSRTHPHVGEATCTISLIEGGAQVNFVPERCLITLDRRMLPGETGMTVLSEYEAVLADFRDGEVMIHPPRLSDEAMETSPDSPLMRSAGAILAEMGLDPAPAGVPFGCDVTKLHRAGIPGIIFGPGSIDQAHAAVEWVDLDQVEMALAFHRRFLLSYGS